MVCSSVQIETLVLPGKPLGVVGRTKNMEEKPRELEVLTMKRFVGKVKKNRGKKTCSTLLFLRYIAEISIEYC